MLVRKYQNVCIQCEYTHLMSNQINVFDLHRLALARRQKERDCFMSVLEKCYSRIRRVNKMYKSQCEFDVPIMIAGKPLFDIETCIKFMIRNLSGNGFVVHFYPPRTLHISWGMFARKSNADDQSTRKDDKKITDAIPAAPASLSLPPPPPSLLPPAPAPRIKREEGGSSSSSSFNKHVKKAAPTPTRAKSIDGSVYSSAHLSRVYDDDTYSNDLKSGRLDKDSDTVTKRNPGAVVHLHRSEPSRPSSQWDNKNSHDNDHGTKLQFLDLPCATRTTDIGNKNNKNEDAASKNMDSVLDAYARERKKQDDDLRRLVPRPKSQAQFYRSISEFRPSGRFRVTPALAALQEEASNGN